MANQHRTETIFFIFSKSMKQPLQFLTSEASLEYIVDVFVCSHFFVFVTYKFSFTVIADFLTYLFYFLKTSPMI